MKAELSKDEGGGGSMHNLRMMFKGTDEAAGKTRMRKTPIHSEERGW